MGLLRHGLGPHRLHLLGADGAASTAAAAAMRAELPFSKFVLYFSQLT